jgi:hypothetical protein
MNQSSALDLKSPLERGVDGFIVDGVCALKIGGEWSVKLEKGHFRDVHFAHERTRTPSLLFLVLSPHLVLSMFEYVKKIV